MIEVAFVDLPPALQRRMLEYLAMVTADGDGRTSANSDGVKEQR